MSSRKERCPSSRLQTFPADWFNSALTSPELVKESKTARLQPVAPGWVITRQLSGYLPFTFASPCPCDQVLSPISNEPVKLLTPFFAIGLTRTKNRQVIFR
jgi:hypothetical protein